MLVSKKISKYYNWHDRAYSSFMIAMMRSMEPRKFKQNEIILRDLEEVDEIYFVLKGDVS